MQAQRQRRHNQTKQCSTTYPRVAQVCQHKEDHIRVAGIKRLLQREVVLAELEQRRNLLARARLLLKQADSKLPPPLCCLHACMQHESTTCGVCWMKKQNASLAVLLRISVSLCLSMAVCPCASSCLCVSLCQSLCLSFYSTAFSLQLFTRILSLYLSSSFPVSLFVSYLCNLDKGDAMCVGQLANNNVRHKRIIARV